ncbi:hypothetical protein V4Q76_02375 [Mycoplasmoides genitalium]|uniref:Uncharacterized protein MG076 n=2 Tax=Mycoplasmoides genitalium TaxID=2097 RepID=Y076_MYCGE|nr:hypothetical protein [Mycoplasmoides genitalium]P47322.1 RecName: Full=Uncharacterized protein MG076 [Mycoplasmoides genitalium G37]ABY79535.1 conserved hypothetical protein [synthetic Mycoplasma genitalium JCVI-1.0]AAC71294.1 conserved hypothetical protein [Mycoplasmoides genitalium G37]AFQ02892.1 hypothetical protein CM9_00435 [Mycoplasmoides genitalium M2321]AFQ03880.1 hypothetical protein CM1_00450 [Mycoplasmoides genitalium M6320]AFQ04382.1 hypothetical protein CM5_00440 [Mycoplasmoid
MVLNQNKNSNKAEYGGIVVSVFYLILFFLILNITIYFHKSTNFTVVVKNSVLTSFFVNLLLVCLQGIFRLKTCDGMRYEISKFNRYLKLGSVYAKPLVSFNQYQDQSATYRQKTSGFWWMNLIVYLVGSLVSGLVSLL